jgi:hypothetical protein
MHLPCRRPTCLDLQSQRLYTATINHAHSERSRGPATVSVDGLLGAEPVFSENFASFGEVQLTSKEQCKDGGWQSFGFKNQGDCVSFLATGGKNPPSGRSSLPLSRWQPRRRIQLQDARKARTASRCPPPRKLRPGALGLCNAGKASVSRRRLGLVPVVLGGSP